MCFRAIEKAAMILANPIPATKDTVLSFFQKLKRVSIRLPLSNTAHSLKIVLTQLKEIPALSHIIADETATNKLHDVATKVIHQCHENVAENLPIPTFPHRSNTQPTTAAITPATTVVCQFCKMRGHKEEDIKKRT